MSDAERASLLDCEECLQPAEAFSVVGNETRLAILEALSAIPTRLRSSEKVTGRSGAAHSASRMASRVSLPMTEKASAGWRHSSQSNSEACSASLMSLVSASSD